MLSVCVDKYSKPGKRVTKSKIIILKYIFAIWKIMYVADIKVTITKIAISVVFYN